GDQQQEIERLRGDFADEPDRRPQRRRHRHAPGREPICRSEVPRRVRSAGHGGAGERLRVSTAARPGPSRSRAVRPAFAFPLQTDLPGVRLRPGIPNGPTGPCPGNQAHDRDDHAEPVQGARLLRRGGRCPAPDVFGKQRVDGGDRRVQPRRLGGIPERVASERSRPGGERANSPPILGEIGPFRPRRTNRWRGAAASRSWRLTCGASSTSAGTRCPTTSAACCYCGWPCWTTCVSTTSTRTCTTWPDSCPPSRSLSWFGWRTRSGGHRTPNSLMSSPTRWEVGWLIPLTNSTRTVLGGSF